MGKCADQNILQLLRAYDYKNIYIVMKPQIIKRQTNIPIFKRLL